MKEIFILFPMVYGFTSQREIADTVLWITCISALLPITRQQHLRLVQIETNCRRNFKVHLKWEISAI